MRLLPKVPRPRRRIPRPAPGHAEALAAYFQTRQERGISSYSEIPPSSAELDQLPDPDRWRPFDWIAFLALPVAAGVDLPIIGDNSTLPTGRIPEGYEAVLDDIEPYLEGGAGPINVPIPPGVGTVIFWRVTVNGSPLIPYGAISTLIGNFGTRGGYPLAQIPPRASIGALVNVTDPGGLYTRIGIRLRGRVLPIKAKPGNP